MFLDSDESYEAIVYFENGKPDREMLYSEFEAVLDLYVPMQELAQKKMQAAYIRLNAQLKITAVVFFRLAFDEKGFVDARWNTPLRQLADSASRGPDLGAGAIKLACRSLCPIEWHAKALWDPQTPPEGNDLKALMVRIDENRIGLVAQALPESDNVGIPTLDSAVPLLQKADFKEEKEALLKEQRLKLDSLKNHYDDQLQELKKKHQERLGNYEQLLETQGLQLQDIQLELEQGKDKLTKQLDKSAYLREKMEAQLLEAESNESEIISTLRQNYANEMESRLGIETADLKEMLSMREVELHYRNEQEASLREQVAKLRLEKDQLLNYSGDQLLTRMNKSGITFVVFHAGLGHLSIPAADVSLYLEDSSAYVAEKCGVTQLTYEKWLAHFQLPICQSLLDNGDICGEPLERVEEPTDFITGESDCCSAHKK